MVSGKKATICMARLLNHNLYLSAYPYIACYPSYFYIIGYFNFAE